MPAAIPFIPAAVGIAGSIIGAKASKKAAKQQVAGQQAAIGTMEQYLSPYANAGANGLSGVQSFVDNGASFADTQAYKDITNSARAGGQFQSGNRATALTDYYATNFRPQRMNELLALPQMGAYAGNALAQGIGGLQQNIGDANAAGTIGAGNNWTNALGALGGVNFSSLLNRNNLGGQPQANLGGQTPQNYFAQPQQQFGTFNTGFNKYGG